MLGVHVHAGVITPISYSYTNGTPAADAPYSDPSNLLLTDGILGTTTPDETWVFWQGTPTPEITFDFGSSVTITSVSLYMIHSSAANSFLPESVSINSGSVTSPDTLPGDPSVGFITFTGSWTGSSLVLDLGHDTNHWIGVSEVEFNAPTTTPEPGTFMAIGVALLAIAASRSRLLLRRQ
jgi:hypothetical protein